MSGELVGREEELQRAELFLEAARHAPRVLVIEGEAGAGKTSIWEAALSSAQGAGSDTVAARPAVARASPRTSRSHRNFTVRPFPHRGDGWMS